MKKKIIAAAASSLLLIAIAIPALGTGVASASPLDGVPGEPNCHGKSISGQAKDHGGIKQAAADHGIASVKEGQELVRELCTVD